MSQALRARPLPQLGFNRVANTAARTTVVKTSQKFLETSVAIIPIGPARGQTAFGRRSKFAEKVAIAVMAVVTVLATAHTTLAQSNDAKPAEQHPAAAQEPAKEQQKVNEFVEAQRLLSGPAGNPECVWLGRRVVSLLWRDDLDTAFRHLDLYDRFGCPGGHIQASFRCLVLHSSNVDPKAADSLNGQVQACWNNPALEVAPAPAAAAASPTTSR
jgi:hypothetical protein